MGQNESSVIVEATEDDFQQLWELEQEVFGDLSYDKFVFRQLFSAHPSLIFVSKSGDELSGYCLASFDVGSDLSYIYSIGVAINFQRRGIGASLLAHTEKKLKDLGAKEVFLHVAPENEVAIKFYKSFDYLEKELIESFGELGQNRLKMLKKL